MSTKPKRGTITLTLTLAEARGLAICADDGATGMLTGPLRLVSGWFDYQSQRLAAGRGIDKLRAAIAKATGSAE